MYPGCTKGAIGKLKELVRYWSRALDDGGAFAGQALRADRTADLAEVAAEHLTGLSAGRVQSVALRLVCERETEIEAFVAREYWTVEADMKTAQGQKFDARLFSLKGEKLEKFTLNNEDKANDAVTVIEKGGFTVASIEAKPGKRNPYPPFTTATLQQEASRKLGFSAQRTMQAAQRLYENGHITYMRTDSVTLSEQAIRSARETIEGLYGGDYLPAEPRRYKTKVKNAQEAHEAIRPAGETLAGPSEVFEDPSGTGVAGHFRLGWTGSTYGLWWNYQFGEPYAPAARHELYYRPLGPTGTPEEPAVVLLEIDPSDATGTAEGLHLVAGNEEALVAVGPPETSENVPACTVATLALSEVR